MRSLAERLLGGLAVASVQLAVAAGAVAAATAEPEVFAAESLATIDEREIVATHTTDLGPEPTGTITLRDAVHAALLRHPSLAVFSLEIRAREARALQAGLRPNPALSVDIEDIAGTGPQRGVDSAETTVSLSQLVELGGKRLRRREAALRERDLAWWDYETTRADVLADVTKAFVAVLGAQQRAALLEDLRRVAEESVRTVQRTVEAGAVSPVEIDRARVVLSRTMIDVTQLTRTLAAARLALAALWGGTRADFAAVAGDLDAVTAPGDYSALSADIDKNPDLARWAAELAARDAVLALERSRRVPDVTLAAGVRRLNETDSGALVFGFTMPLLVFDRNQGAILEARRRMEKARAERDAVQVATRSALGRAYEDLAAAFERATTLRDQVIPQARAAYEGSLAAYRQGLFRNIEVLDAQRTLFELRGQYIEALAAYHVARADLERLSGTALEAH